MLKKIVIGVLGIGGIIGIIIGGYNLFAIIYLAVTSKPVESPYSIYISISFGIAIICFSVAFLLNSNEKAEERIYILEEQLDRIADKVNRMQQ
jgi:membrane-bound ClpP family serine protease